MTLKLDSLKISDIVFWTVALISLTFYNLTTPIDNPDAYYYVDAVNRIFNGIPDSLRTPVYPIFLWLSNVKPLETSHGSLPVTIVQSIVYLFSIVSLISICNRTIKKRIIREVVRYYYVLFYFASFCNELLTESFSISGMVILIDWIIQFHEKNDTKRGLAIIILLTLLIFLRPTFIIFLIILPCVWLYYYLSTHRKNNIWLTIGLLFPTVLFLAYCKSFEKHYDKFTYSIVSEINTIDHLKEGKCWDLSCVTNDETRKAMEKIGKHGYGDYSGVFIYVNSNGNTDMLDHACNEMIEAHRVSFFRQKIGTFFRSTSFFFYSWIWNDADIYSLAIDAAQRFFAIPLSFFYLMTFLSPFFVLIIWRRYKKIPVKTIIIVSVLFMYTIGIAYAALNSHSRLLAPALPLFLVYIGMFFDYILNFNNNDPKNDTLHMV